MWVEGQLIVCICNLLVILLREMPMELVFHKFFVTVAEYDCILIKIAFN